MLNRPGGSPDAGNLPDALPNATDKKPFIRRAERPPPDEKSGLTSVEAGILLDYV